MQEKISFEKMQPLLNETFILHVDSDHNHEVELVDVSQMQATAQATYSWQKKAQPAEPTSFALVFRVPHELGATQKMYDISHSQLGALGAIFLVPIAEDEDGLYLEAIFS